jgi:phage-related protein
MKMLARRFAISLFASFVVVALAGSCRGSPESEKTKEDARATVEKAGDTVKDAIQQGKEVATNVAANVKEFTTNAVAKVKEGTTNVIAKVKEGAQKAGAVATNVVGDVKAKVKEIRQ